MINARFGFEPRTPQKKNSIDLALLRDKNLRDMQRSEPGTKN